MNPPQLLMAIGVVIILAVTHGYAYMTGSKHKDNEWKAAQLETERKARETEKMWQGVVNETNTNWQNKNRATQRALDIALDSLRDRPNRPVPGASVPDCKGGTGADLFRTDAEFLVREASRADRIRNALEACYNVLDKVK